MHNAMHKQYTRHYAIWHRCLHTYTSVKDCVQLSTNSNRLICTLNDFLSN